jgi:hypothetical protein
MPVAPICIQPIEKTGQQDRSGAVDSIELREVNIDRHAPA